MTPTRNRAGQYIPPGQELQAWLPGILDATPDPLPKALGVLDLWVDERMTRHLRAAVGLSAVQRDREVDAYLRLRAKRDALRECAVRVKGNK